MKASRNISNSMFMRKRRPSFFTSTASLFPPPLWGRVREGGDLNALRLRLTPPPAAHRRPPPPPRGRETPADPPPPTRVPGEEIFAPLVCGLLGGVGALAPRHAP